MDWERSSDQFGTQSLPQYICCMCPTSTPPEIHVGLEGSSCLFGGRTILFPQKTQHVLKNLGVTQRRPSITPFTNLLRVLS